MRAMFLLPKDVVVHARMPVHLSQRAEAHNKIQGVRCITNYMAKRP